MDRGAMDDLEPQITALPDSEPARQLAFQALGSEEALQRLLALHPSCAHLDQALSFYNAAGRPEESRKIEDRLAQREQRKQAVESRLASRAGRKVELASRAAGRAQREEERAGRIAARETKT